MNKKSTSKKRPVVARRVEPVVGAEDRCFRIMAEIDLEGTCHGAFEDAWIRFEMHEDGETDLFISDHIMSATDDKNIGGCYYAEGIPKAAMIILRDYLNAAFPLNSPNTRITETGKG